MKTWTLAAVCAAAASVGSLLVHAVTLSVSPTEGGIGQNVSLVNFGFVPVKRPKVTLVPRPEQTARRRVVPKLLSFNDAQIDVQVVSGVAGVYDVLVTPRDRGVAAVTLPEPFTILLPEPTSVEPANGPGNVPVAILGSKFGTFRGRVTIGGRVARVTRWLADRIEVVVPKRLKPGAQPIVVTNRAGKSTAPLAFTVDGGTTGGASRLFKYDLGTTHFETTNQDGLYFNATHNVSQDFFGVGASVPPTAVPSLGLNINNPVFATPMPYDVTTTPSATGTVTATYAAGGAVYMASGLNGFTITITGYADGVIEGLFSGEMSIVAGGGPSPIFITNGQFKALVQIVGQ